MKMDKMIEWWRDPSSEGIPIDPAETYWLAAHTKKINGAWEVAIVRWRYRSPYLVALIREGKIIAGNDD